MRSNNLTDVGARLRDVRLQRQLSLASVASRAEISVATLSRIETAKQALDVNLLVTLAHILGVAPAVLLGGSENPYEDMDVLAERLSGLRTAERAELLRSASRRRRKSDPSAVVDDLLSTLDLVREELQAVSRAARRRRR